jgi:hypothetical protein
MRAPPEAVMQMKGSLLLDRRLDAAHETLADHRAHRSAEKLELETGHHHRHGLDRALHHHHRVGFAGILVGGDQAIDVALAVLELQRIDRDHFGCRSRSGPRGRAGIEPDARAQAKMMTALRADVLVALQVGAVQHRLAGRTLGPKTLRHRLARAFSRLIFGGSSFCNQLMRQLLRGRPLRADAAETPDPRRSLAGGAAFDFLDDAAADDHRIGHRADARGGGTITDAEADADRHADLARISGMRAPPRRDRAWPNRSRP